MTTAARILALAAFAATLTATAPGALADSPPTITILAQDADHHTPIDATLYVYPHGTPRENTHAGTTYLLTKQRLENGTTHLNQSTIPGRECAVSAVLSAPNYYEVFLPSIPLCGPPAGTTHLLDLQRIGTLHMVPGTTAAQSGPAGGQGDTYGLGYNRHTHANTAMIAAASASVGSSATLLALILWAGRGGPK